MLSYWKELLIVLLEGASNLERSHLLTDYFVIDVLNYYSLKLQGKTWFKFIMHSKHGDFQIRVTTIKSFSISDSC